MNRKSLERKISIGVGTLQEALDRFESAWKSAERGTRIAPEHRLTFSSLPRLLRELSPARWMLIETLRAGGRMTVYALAKRLNRNYKNVHTDVARLAELGLIERTKDRKVHVPWDVIAAELRLAA
ncbi:MAG: MarR family transcriptional regulator [Nitrospirae bacterium]|nr:MarR family transcriptional regulator [Nitrospirota bacterium]